jgi:hypothetical protein
MVKSQFRIIGALSILLMLGASPLSVNYAFAENEENQVQNGELRAILTEKVVDGKLLVHHYSLPEDLSDEDLKRMLSFDGQMSWGYVNYKAYQSGIVIFDGKASKIDGNLWKISIEDASNGNLVYKVVFSGKIVETKENEFAISFMNSMIKNLETSQNVRLLENVDSPINSEKSNGSNQEFRNSISVNNHHTIFSLID